MASRLQSEANGRALIAKPNLARELDTTPRTVDRWTSDPALNFPAPLKMNRRVVLLPRRG